MTSVSDDNREYRVQNEPGAALPNTGGPGTSLYYILGLLLLFLAGAGSIAARKKKAAL